MRYENLLVNSKALYKYGQAHISTFQMDNLYEKPIMMPIYRRIYVFDLQYIYTCAQ